MTIAFETVDEYAVITLDRPDKHNALDKEMADGLARAIAEARRADVRALLVRANGSSFCSGRDLSDPDLAGDPDELLRKIFNPLVIGLASFPTPTVAAVHGACLGVGLGLALACDFVLATPDLRIGSPFAKLGGVLDSGGHLFLLRAVGRRRAFEMICTGEFLDGAGADREGLVSRVVEKDQLEDDALELTRTLATGPTLAFRHSKRILNSIGGNIEEVLERETVAQGEVALSDDFHEGLCAFRERRTPVFRGR